MPLYEYECFVCGHGFERIRKVADAASVTCPECGGKVRRLLGVPALQFKGSGWYVTDYGKGNGGRSTALAKQEDSSPPKSESKPEKQEPAKKPADST
ncbi:MAG: zinc ribbon domain-containing protein [Acidobacteriota bacterium]|jgi:putative FmdB family regulatory protein